MVTKGQAVATLGLVNGMIGGTILVLPLIGIRTGFVFIPLVGVVYGCLSCYTCYLISYHLGECPNVRLCILEHFRNNHFATVIYNFVIGGSILGFLINYFHLIILQIQGFINPSPFIALGTFITLLLLTIIMRSLHFGEKLLAIGIISIIGYCSFLIWAQATSPSGIKTIPSVGPGYIDLSASLIMGYAIHDFVVQVLLMTTTPDKFTRVIITTYIFGTIIYIFISYGCYAIINREPRISDPETIEEYFGYGSWTVQFIQIIYFIHLMSTSPEFCIIMRYHRIVLRIRLLQMFKIQDTPSITLPQLLIYVLTYGICYTLYVMRVKIATLIEINGSVIGFLYVFLMPIAVHIKCVYFSKHDENGYMVSEDHTAKNGEIIEFYGTCKCRLQYYSGFTKILELLLQLLILALGFLTVFYTMRSLFFQQIQQLPAESDL